MLFDKVLTIQATLNAWPCPFILTDSLGSLLWNLYKYYTQFSESIQTKITQLRSPIEKELKVGETQAAKTYVIYIIICSSCLLLIWCNLYLDTYRTLSKSPSGMMSVFGPSSSQWRRHTGESDWLEDFFQQGWIAFIKDDSKDIYNVTEDFYFK